MFSMKNEEVTNDNEQQEVKGISYINLLEMFLSNKIY